MTDKPQRLTPQPAPVENPLPTDSIVEHDRKMKAARQAIRENHDVLEQLAEREDAAREKPKG